MAMLQTLVYLQYRLHAITNLGIPTALLSWLFLSALSLVHGRGTAHRNQLTTVTRIAREVLITTCGARDSVSNPGIYYLWSNLLCIRNGNGRGFSLKLFILGLQRAARYVRHATVGACRGTSNRQEHKIIQRVGPEQDTIFHLHVIACRRRGSHIIFVTCDTLHYNIMHINFSCVGAVIYTNPQHNITINRTLSA